MEICTEVLQGKSISITGSSKDCHIIVLITTDENIEKYDKNFVVEQLENFINSVKQHAGP